MKAIKDRQELKTSLVVTQDSAIIQVLLDVFLLIKQVANLSSNLTAQRIYSLITLLFLLEIEWNDYSRNPVHHLLVHSSNVHREHQSGRIGSLPSRKIWIPRLLNVAWWIHSSLSWPSRDTPNRSYRCWWKVKSWMQFIIFELRQILCFPAFRCTIHAHMSGFCAQTAR